MVQCLGGLLLWASVIWGGNLHMVYQDWQAVSGDSCVVHLVHYVGNVGYSLVDDGSAGIPTEIGLYPAGRDLYMVWVDALPRLRQPWVAHWLAESQTWDKWALPSAGSSPWIMAQHGRLLVKWISPDGWVWVYDLGKAPATVRFPLIGR